MSQTAMMSLRRQRLAVEALWPSTPIVLDCGRAHAAAEVAAAERALAAAIEADPVARARAAELQRARERLQRVRAE